jgi:putative molybdopterin biosynthesis protein
MTRREFRDLASPATAREALDELDLSGATETVPLVEASGHSLAERVDAGIDVPGFDRAAMDGFAVRAADTFGATERDPVTLPVVDTVHAGSEPERAVEPDEAVQVATGAVMPDGADTVVPVERTVEGDESVDITSAVAPGDSVMPRGADIAAGDRALGPGTHLGPRHVGLLAALGRERVQIRAPPQVAVVSTGDELVQPGDPLRSAAGQIYDVNSHSIAAAVEATGADAGRYTPAADDEAALRETLRTAAAETDLLLTSGSTSAGTADMLYRLVEETGEILVHGVAIKPGRPLLVGRVFGTPYVGLPGYPVSALSVFRTFVAPRLRAAGGVPEPATAEHEARLATRVRYDGGRLRLLPVGLVTDGDGGAVAYAPAKGSGATTTLVETDGVVRMEPETALLSAGNQVTVERFDDTPIPQFLPVGDPDPAFSALLDGMDATRHLTLAPDDARRWFDDRIPDVLVAAPTTVDDPLDGSTLARWTREWGLVVDPNSEIASLDDLLAGDCRFVNLTDSLALRHALDERLAALTDDPDAIDGYHRELPGIASGVRSVADGRADAALGLRAAATTHDLDFVSLGHQPIVVRANPDRTAKESVQAFRRLISEELPDVLDGLPGYDAESP